MNLAPWADDELQIFRELRLSHVAFLFVVYFLVTENVECQSGGQVLNKRGNTQF